MQAPPSQGGGSEGPVAMNCAPRSTDGTGAGEVMQAPPSQGGGSDGPVAIRFARPSTTRKGWCEAAGSPTPWTRFHEKASVRIGRTTKDSDWLQKNCRIKGSVYLEDLGIHMLCFSPYNSRAFL